MTFFALARLRRASGVVAGLRLRWQPALGYMAGWALFGCTSPPAGPPARALDAMCVLHSDAWALNAISLNSKVFTAKRDSATSSTGFGEFRSVAGPFGDGTLGVTNLDGLPSVYAISEAWFRGLSFNEAVRAEVIPALRTDPAGNPLIGEPGSGTGSRWRVAAQDFTGAWRGVGQARRNSAYARDQVADNNSTTVAQLPQWMHVGELTPQLFFCAGTLTGDMAQVTSSLFEYTPAGLDPRARPSIIEIQDVLNGDDRFRPDPPPEPPVGGNRIAPPAPVIAGPSPQILLNQVVQCAMTQNADDVTTRILHVVAVSGTQLLHAMLSNFGPVTQPLSNGTVATFSRFRTVSTWREITQAFPASTFGALEHVAVVAARDRTLHIFFVGHGNDGRYKLWHTKRFVNDVFSLPLDVLQASGDSNTGTVYNMPVSAAFCPARGNRHPTTSDLDEEIVVAWTDVDTRSIVVRQVVRTPREWAVGRGASAYSPMQIVQPSGLTIRDGQGNELATTALRTRVSLRPYSD